MSFPEMIMVFHASDGVSVPICAKAFEHVESHIQTILEDMEFGEDPIEFNVNFTSRVLKEVFFWLRYHGERCIQGYVEQYEVNDWELDYFYRNIEIVSEIEEAADYFGFESLKRMLWRVEELRHGLNQ